MANIQLTKQEQQKLFAKSKCDRAKNKTWRRLIYSILLLFAVAMFAINWWFEGDLEYDTNLALNITGFVFIGGLTIYFGYLFIRSNTKSQGSTIDNIWDVHTQDAACSVANVDGNTAAGQQQLAQSVVSSSGLSANAAQLDYERLKAKRVEEQLDEQVARRNREIIARARRVGGY